jgi:chaperonin cofactor prefoldin
MDINQIADYLNKWRGGEILLILVGCYTVIKKGYIAIKKVMEWNRSTVKRDLDKQAQIEGILTDITTLKQEMDSLSNDFNTYKGIVDNRLTESNASASSGYEDMNKSFVDLERSIEEMTPKIDLMEKKIEKLDRQIADLLRSDIEYVKSYITEAYNKYVKDEQCIDLMTLQNIESVYNRLLAESGTEDEFLAKLMRELRNLPTTKVDKE